MVVCPLLTLIVKLDDVPADGVFSVTPPGAAVTYSVFVPIAVGLPSG